MKSLLPLAIGLLAVVALSEPSIASEEAFVQLEALERLEAVEELLERLAPLERWERQEEIAALPEEVRELLYRRVLPISAIGSQLQKAREAGDWDAEVEILTRWAEHEAVRKARAEARAQREAEAN